MLRHPHGAADRARILRREEFDHAHDDCRVVARGFVLRDRLDDRGVQIVRLAVASRFSPEARRAPSFVVKAIAQTNIPKRRSDRATEDYLA